MEQKYIIEMRNITKRFPGIVANDNITLQLKPGEIHALLGENGAGKSTLMSILFGLYEPDEGQIVLKGQPVKIKDPNDATKYGIGMVHQHFMLVDTFTGLENIILGYEDTKGPFLRYDKTLEKLKNIQDKYGLSCDLNKKIGDMTVGMQQRVEILKMLYRDNEILIFDEPTAVLTPDEIEGLMQVIKTLKSEGKTILFISHKLNEIKEVADRVTVLRKGKYIGTYDVNSKSTEELAELMVGRHVSFTVEKNPPKIGNEVLRVQNLYVKNENKFKVKDVSLSVRQGEIVALLGIDGNGQDEFIEAITGLRNAYSGKVFIKDTDVTKMPIIKRNKLGLSHIPGDRHKYGLVLDYSMMYNVILERYKEEKYNKLGFLKFNNINDYCNYLITKYDVRSSEGAKTITRSMSGGNQQKVIVAREIDRNNDLLIAVQPTRGLDVGAIEMIHKELIKTRDAKKAILLVSLELDEVFDIADRIIVIHEGEIVGEFDPHEIDYKTIGLYMSGAKRDTKPSTDLEAVYHGYDKFKVKVKSSFNKLFNGKKK